MSRTSVQTVTVASGDTFSSVIDARNNRIVGLTVPISMTSQMFLQAGALSNSADLYRVQTIDGAGDWSVVSGGSAARSVAVSEVMGPFPWGRIELGASAVDTFSFVFIGKAA